MRKRFIASATFVAVVAVLGVTVVVRGGESQDDGGSSLGKGSSSPSPGATAPASPSGGDKGDGDGSCPRLADTSQEIPASAPQAEWQLVRSVAVPASKTAGPAVVEGDVARCYAHTPSGALLASMQIATRYLFAADWKTVTEKQSVGDGKEEYVKYREKIEASRGPATVDPNNHGQFAGYKIVSYSPESAVIQQVNKFSNSALQVGTVTVQWTGGDWRLVLSASPPPVTTVDSLDGFTPFGGV